MKTDKVPGKYFIVIMGVSGSGKSTIGELLAKRLQADFVEGDDYHAEASVKKMAAGIPLSTADRLPWLHTLRDILDSHIADKKSTVLSCSALKKEYRDILRQAGPEVSFVFLDVSVSVLKERLRSRDQHFMKADMLKSQLETLDYPSKEERNMLIVDGDGTIETIISTIMTQLQG